MIPLQMTRELRIDIERRLHADNHVAGLVRDPSNCEKASLASGAFQGERLPGCFGYWHPAGGAHIVERLEEGTG